MIIEGIEGIEENEEWTEDTWIELEKARGEKLINLEKKEHKKSKDDGKPLEQIILTFEDTDSLNTEEIYRVSIKASSINIVEHSGKDNNLIKAVEAVNLVGKRFLEYLAWHSDNETGPILELTLAFEDHYSIEVSCCSIIEEYKDT
ncbi:MAG TPA: hypothetical protein VF324_00230 [Methanobacterium sp.]